MYMPIGRNHNTVFLMTHQRCFYVIGSMKLMVMTDDICFRLICIFSTCPWTCWKVLHFFSWVQIYVADLNSFDPVVIGLSIYSTRTDSCWDIIEIPVCWMEKDYGCLTNSLYYIYYWLAYCVALILFIYCLI